MLRARCLALSISLGSFQQRKNPAPLNVSLTKSLFHDIEIWDLRHEGRGFRDRCFIATAAPGSKGVPLSIASISKLLGAIVAAVESNPSVSLIVSMS
jgi:hypothetical protein